MTSREIHWNELNNRKSLITLAVAIALLITAFVLIASALFGQTTAPTPEFSGSTNQQATLNGPVLPYSTPTSLKIPAININSSIYQVGQRADGDIEVPRGDNKDKPAWYKYSPAPGQFGASVIIGHVDTAENGPSIFFNLGKLKSGDKIIIERADNKKAVFSIRSVLQYTKDEFPTRMVYTSKDNAAELRLITCSGNFVAGSYTKNIVVYARLVEFR